MFVCHRKKAMWYVTRGLATEIQADPLVVRLNFEPNGPGHSGDPFFLQTRENLCVRCGKRRQLTRHHVVPYCYRRYFPDVLKSHSSMDILPICEDCHEEYECHANLLKREIAAEMGLPPHICGVHVDSARIRALGFARTLTGVHKDKIPTDRKQIMMQVIRDYYGAGSDEDHMNRALAEPYENLRVLGHVPVEKRIVERLSDLHSFVVRWRKHFIETMQPKHMPPHWDAFRPLQRPWS